MNPVAQMKLTSAHEWTGCNDGKQYRREEWTITGGEIDPSWRLAGTRHERAANWEPSCRFSLYIVNGVVDPRLSSYGGVVWPTAWTDLFAAHRTGTYAAGVEITDLGLQLRAASLAEVVP